MMLAAATLTRLTTLDFQYSCRGLRDQDADTALEHIHISNDELSLVDPLRIIVDEGKEREDNVAQENTILTTKILDNLIDKLMTLT